MNSLLNRLSHKTDNVLLISITLRLAYRIYQFTVREDSRFGN